MHFAKACWIYFFEIFCYFFVFYIIAFLLLWKCIERILFGSIEVRSGGHWGTDQLEWGFCDSGEFAASIEGNDNNWMTAIYIYDALDRNVYEYSYHLTFKQPAGFYWHDRHLALIHLDGKEARISLYQLDHSRRSIKLLKTRSFPCELERITKIDTSIRHYRAICMEGKEYTLLMDPLKEYVQIYLIPRCIGAKYPPKRYFCECAGRLRRVGDIESSGVVVCSSYPVFNDSIVYCEQFVYYSNENIYKNMYKKYFRFDLSKLENIFEMGDDVPVEQIVLNQDTNAVKQTTFKIRGKKRPTFRNSSSEATDKLRFFHRNFENKTIKMIKVKEDGDSIIPHPFGSLLVFCRNGTKLSGEKRRFFHTLTEKIPQYTVYSLKTLATRQLLFTKRPFNNRIFDQFYF